MSITEIREYFPSCADAAPVYLNQDASNEYVRSEWFSLRDDNATLALIQANPITTQLLITHAIVFEPDEELKAPELSVLATKFKPTNVSECHFMAPPKSMLGVLQHLIFCCAPKPSTNNLAQRFAEMKQMYDTLFQRINALRLQSIQLPLFHKRLPSKMTYEQKDRWQALMTLALLMSIDAYAPKNVAVVDFTAVPNLHYMRDFFDLPTKLPTAHLENDVFVAQFRAAFKCRLQREEKETFVYTGSSRKIHLIQGNPERPIDLPEDLFVVFQHLSFLDVFPERFKGWIDPSQWDNLKRDNQEGDTPFRVSAIKGKGLRNFVFLFIPTAVSLSVFHGFIYKAFQAGLNTSKSAQIPLVQMTDGRRTSIKRSELAAWQTACDMAILRAILAVWALKTGPFKLRIVGADEVPWQDLLL